MFFYLFIFLFCATVAFAQRAADSVRQVQGVPVIIKGVKADDLPPTVPIAIGELRNAETLAAAPSLSEVLPILHPSFDVRSYGTLGGISLPMFRGLAPEYIAVYRNGIKLTNAQNSLTDLERYTSRTSSTVSIISSAQSLSLAGDIAGAAVSITSLTPESTQYASGASLLTYNDANSLNETEYYLRASQLIDASSVRVAASYRSSDGAYPFYQKSSRSYVTRSNNDAYLATAEVEPSITLSERSSVRPLFVFSEAERGVPGVATIDGEGASTPLARQYDRDILGALTYHGTITDSYSHSLATSYQVQHETYTNPTLNIDARYRNTISSAAYRATGHYWEKLTALVSLEFDENTLESNQHDSVGEITRERLSISFTGKYHLFDNLSIIASGRAERISDIGVVQMLPAGSIVYVPYPNWEVSVLASKFFHAPTFNQLYWRIGGNASLVSERGESFELRSAYRIAPIKEAALSLLTTFFQTEIRDQIIWTPRQDGIWSPINVQRVRVRGIEFDARLDHQLSTEDAMSLRLAWTYLQSANLTESSLYYQKELPYSMPLRLIATGVLKRTDIGSLGLVCIYRARRHTDFANNPSGELDGVTTLDVHFRSIPLPVAGVYVEPQLSVINIGNQQYEEGLGYPVPGRVLKLSFDLTFNPEL